MVAINFQHRIKTFLAVAAGGFLIANAAPAMASADEGAIELAAVASTANTASSGAVAPLDLAAPQSIGSSADAEDTEFKQLFASWKALDQGANAQPGVAGGIAPAPIGSISVPSRMPLDGARLSSKYGMRNHPVTGGMRRHKGIDLAAPTGTPIYATADGIVSKAQRFSSYGLYVSIEHGGDLQTRYAHMSRIAVADGARVKKGDVIGYVGSTGRSTGPHLHYEVRVAGKAVNPMPYMAENAVQTAMSGAGRGGAE